MKPHVKLYLETMGYTPDEYILCECCGERATDIHHIKARGMGGTKKPDTIENLMAMCRRCHQDLGDRKQFIDYLREAHQIRMKERGL